MSVRMTRKRAVTWWTGKAVDKYFLGFMIPDKISTHYDGYEPFFYAHGLEVLCKAFVIGKKFPDYRGKPFQEAKRVIDGIAKSLGHDLIRLVKEMISYDVLPANFLSEVHHRSHTNNVDFTNEDMLKTLKAVYLEARYPVVELDHQRYFREKVKDNPKATNKRLPEIPKMSHEVERFSRKLFFVILGRIEKDFRLKMSRNKFSTDISDGDWMRFTNLFFRYDGAA